jgi:transposase, IS5 family
MNSISHLKSDSGMDRNHLKGKDRDRVNAILAGCGFKKGDLFP